MLVTGARAIAVIEGPPAAVLQATATVFAAGSAGMTLLDCRNVTDRLFPGSWFVAACEEDDDDLGVTTDIIRLTNAVAEACPDRTLPD
jgi:hypothetical protein